MWGGLQQLTLAERDDGRTVCCQHLTEPLGRVNFANLRKVDARLRLVSHRKPTRPYGETTQIAWTRVERQYIYVA